MTIVTGTRLGRYEIRSKIGEGGMGEVYLAQDTELERTVALKVLPADVADDQQRMNRFVQEAKAASALNHPNILTIHEIVQADATRFIATEFIDGETLRQHMTAAQLNLNETLDIAIQIASALEVAHEAGITHRDIKPENIMLRRRDSIVKVLDFGLAKLTAPESSEFDAEAATKAFFKTDPGTVVGTAIYMSPEQARGIPVDGRTDLFSLGVVPYEMVASHVPFAGSSTNEVISAILSKEQPAPLARFAHNVPDRLEASRKELMPWGIWATSLPGPASSVKQSRLRQISRSGQNTSSSLPFGLAVLYAGLGDRDEAFAYLERSRIERDGRMYQSRFERHSTLSGAIPDSRI